MDSNTPLFKSNPELFKTYVLNIFSDDEILLVKGITTEDKTLASEMHIKVLINLYTKLNAEVKNLSTVLILADMRRKVRKFMLSLNKMEKALASTRQLWLSPSLHETKPELFKKYVLQNFSTRLNTIRVEHITLGDRVLKNSILTLFMFEEIPKLSAQVHNKKLSIVKADLNQNIEKILQAYNRLLPIRNTN